MGGQRDFEETSLSGLTHYELLKISVSASSGEIRRSYRELSLLYHPDTTRLPWAIATRRFQILNEAYATLSNPERRLHYDRSIGYSSVTVVRGVAGGRSPSANNAKPHTKFDPKFSAYLDAEDRPLSSGELFALSLMGITFVGCIGLAILLSIVKS
jgi:curved DNA-binding protein CbpA